MKIDYRVLDNPANEEFKQSLLDTYLANFSTFLKDRFIQVRGKPDVLEIVFKMWWMTKGPVGFTTTEDAFRFKKELLILFKEKFMFLSEEAE